MSLTGSVRNGVVVLDNGYQLAEGTVVEVVVKAAPSCTALPERPPLGPALRQELDRRLAEHLANPGDVIPWEQVEAEALARMQR
jgi:putative addiction module component (TIGR02574 family)